MIANEGTRAWSTKRSQAKNDVDCQDGGCRTTIRRDQRTREVERGQGSGGTEEFCLISFIFSFLFIFSFFSLLFVFGK
jgi:hypothetical protein